MTPEPRKKPPGEILFNLLLLLFSLFMLWQAYRIAGFSALSSPGAVPLAAALLMAVAAALVALGGVKARVGGARPVSTFYRRVTPPVVLIFIGIVIAFAAVLEWLGFLPAAFGFLLISIGFLYRRGFLNALWVSLGSLLLVYVVFRLVFSVVLPEGVVPEREILAWLETLVGGARPRP